MTITKENYQQLNLAGLYPFVDDPLDLNSEMCRYIDWLKMINNNEKINWLKLEGNCIFDELYHSDTYKTGIYKMGGWVFNFGLKWKTYFVKYKNEPNIKIQLAPNKTFIRKFSWRPSEIIGIFCKIDFDSIILRLKELKNNLGNVLNGTGLKSNYCKAISQIIRELKDGTT